MSQNNAEFEVSQEGLDLIKSFEGLKLHSYICPAGVLTVGYGHTGPDVTPEMEITQQVADELLKQDVDLFAKQVNKLVKGLDITQGMFDACVSFAFNLGIESFKKSTLLKYIVLGEYQSAAKEFDRWNKARDSSGNLVPLDGLTRRRAAERKLFEG